MSDVSELIGKTLKSVVEDGESITFTLTDDSEYRMFHEQDCCESVQVEDIVGDLQDLVGTPILSASEDSSSGPWSAYEEPDLYPDESFTWTFYKIDTVKGGVTIRWYGSSNGYYSERVSFVKMA